MASNRNYSEVETLHLYHVTLANSRDSDKIVKALLTMGYDSEKLDAGDELYAKTSDAYYKSHREKSMMKSVHISFSEMKKSLHESFTRHRQMAKVAFRNDPKVTRKLGLNVIAPRVYSEWMEFVKKFYTEAAANKQALGRLSEFKLDGEVLAGELERIRELEKARAHYIRKKGDSQTATAMKDAAFDEIYEWMKDFYPMAKIALRGNPKMMIALGKVVKD